MHLLCTCKILDFFDCCIDRVQGHFLHLAHNKRNVILLLLISFAWKNVNILLREDADH